MTNDLCICGPMTRSEGFCECDAKPDLKPMTFEAVGDEEGKAELRYGGLSCCGDPGDCVANCESTARTVLSQPYFDSNGNEGTVDEVYSSPR